MLAFQSASPVSFSLPPVSAATYARRRLVAGILLAALVVAAAIGVSWLQRPPAGDLRVRPVAEVQVLVQPGDTVWSIAEGIAAGTDVRPVVDAIVAANGGAELTVGQRLDVALP